MLLRTLLTSNFHFNFGTHDWFKGKSGGYVAQSSNN